MILCFSVGAASALAPIDGLTVAASNPSRFESHTNLLLGMGVLPLSH